MVTTNAQPDGSKASRAANSKRNPRIVLATFVLAALVLSALCAPALAAAPPPLWKKGQNCGDGSKIAKGECGFKAEEAKSGLNLIETMIPRGIASDPETGHLYVADQNNQRVVELTAWGDFVKAWGWGVKDGSPELQSCTAQTGCLRTRGSLGFGAVRTLGAGGAGELNEPMGLAVDSGGNVYVVDYSNHRIQKFDREGHFLRTWGGGVISGGAAGAGDLSSGSTKVVNLTTTAKAFEIGQRITGTGIPAGTIVSDLGIGTLTLSKAATASGSAIAITAPEGAGNVPTNERKTVSIEGSPTGGSFTLTYVAGELAATLASGSNQVTNTHVGSELTVGSFHVGDRILAQQGAIPAATSIAAIDTATGSLTLSANATSTTSNERVAATETTAPIPYNATAAEVREKLQALTAIGAGNVEVEGAAGGPWTVEFKGPLLGDVNLEPRGVAAHANADGSGLTPAGTKVAVATVREGASAPEVCAIAADCRSGVEAAGNGAFGNWPPSGSSLIAVGPGNVVYVGDKGRIEKFDSSGAYLSQIALPEKNEKGEALPAPASAEVGALAVDPGTGFLYYAYANKTYDFNEAKHNVFKLDPATGKVAKTLEVDIPRALATDEQGGVYVFDQGSFTEKGNLITRVLKFNSAGNFVEVVAQNESSSKQNEFNESTGIATGSACYSKGFGFYLANFNQKNSFIRAYGQNPDPALCPPPELAPSIDDQYAVSVNSSDATLKAQINPHFWGDATYYLEYGTSPCAEGGCAKQPAPPGSSLGGGAVEADVTTAGVFLSGLAPNTTYHYRFVAESGGGGPVIGKGASETEVGQEGSFNTFPEPEAPNTGCPNQAFRGGASAALPDCRAFELVSPVDKGGGDIAVRSGGFGLVRLNQSSLSGDRIAYSSYRAFAGPLSQPFVSQYLAKRDPAAGWASESISAPQEGVEFLQFSQIESLYKAFSGELDTGWNWTNTEPVLGPGGQPGVPNIYRRDNATGSYQACTAAERTEEESLGAEPQGASKDQRHMVFRSQGRLSEEAAPGNKFQLYMCSFPEGGGAASLKLLSILPNGAPSGLENQAGSPADGLIGDDRGRASVLAGAVSEDGERVFWTAASKGAAPGTIYLRLNALSEATASGECSEAEPQGACTLAVSGTVSSERARFWGATPDGGEALFEAVEKNSASPPGDLYLYDTAKAIAGEAPDTLLAHKSKGVLGFSRDLSRIYFLSEEALGGGALAGKPNLYLYEGGEAPVTSFIATLSAVDTANGSGQAVATPSPVNERPDQHTARVSPSGDTLAFMSNSAALAQTVAGYDNADQGSGEPDAEVYRYSTTSGELACVSCNRSGARPSGRQLITFPVEVWAAARLPSWENSLDPLHPLSEDGKRIFFESFEALVLADTNGKADVYEWELAGSGDCKEGLASYVPASGGCISLISSGKSPADAEFIDASPQGRDAFFTTAASLLPQDPGSIDIYDARAGGGFAPPPAPPAPCDGDACQSPPAPPNDPTAASAAFHGTGDLSAAKKQKVKARCGPGKRTVRRKGKTRCEKARPKRRANTNRRAGR